MPAQGKARGLVPVAQGQGLQFRQVQSANGQLKPIGASVETPGSAEGDVRCSDEVLAAMQGEEVCMVARLAVEAANPPAAALQCSALQGTTHCSRDQLYWSPELPQSALGALPVALGRGKAAKLATPHTLLPLAMRMYPRSPHSSPQELRTIQYLSRGRGEGWSGGCNMGVDQAQPGNCRPVAGFLLHTTRHPRFSEPPEEAQAQAQAQIPPPTAPMADSLLAGLIPAVAHHHHGMVGIRLV